MAQLEPLARRVQQRLGGPRPTSGSWSGHRPVVKPLREHMVGKISTPLWILLGTVGIVFLIACANVANLFTVRAENRRRDLAVRRALGAGRGDLLRSQLTEALLLAAAGGVAGALHRVGRCSSLVRAAPDAVAGGFSGAPIPGSPPRASTSRRCSSPWASRSLAACAFGLLPALSFLGPAAGQRPRRPGAASSAADADARCAGRRANRRRSGAARWIGAAHAQFLAAQQRGCRATTRKTSSRSRSRQPPGSDDRAAISRFQYAFMDRLKALPGVESGGIHHHAAAGRGRRQPEHHDAELEASGAEAPLVRVAAPAARTSRRWGSSCSGAASSSGSRKSRVLPNRDHQSVGCRFVVSGRGSDRQAGRARTGGPTGPRVIGVVEDV